MQTKTCFVVSLSFRTITSILHRFWKVLSLAVIHIIFVLQVHVVREKITWPGARIKKKEEGMPNYENNNVKGDLFITFDVEFPRGSFEDDEKEGWYRSSLFPHT